MVGMCPRKASILVLTSALHHGVAVHEEEQDS